MEKVELVDFSECKFIKEEMWFYTYEDFCKNRYFIKKLFKQLSKNGKLFYMWYVYANIHMNETYKNKVWDYLNDYLSDGDLLYALRFYRAK